VVASTAAMIAVDLMKPLKIQPEVLCSLRDLSLSHCLASIFETELKHGVLVRSKGAGGEGIELMTQQSLL
jgi:hypothetical protein